MSTGLLPVGPDRLWWSDTGGDGPPVVLSHAGITDSSAWESLAGLLPDLRLVCWDQRGYGRSPVATAAYTTGADLLAVIDAALDGTGADQVHLVGNSMGGEASLAVAVAHPTRVASLTLLCPGIGGYPWPDPSPAEEALHAEYRGYLEAGDVDGLTRLSRAEWCRSGVDDYLRTQLAASVRADLANGSLAGENPPQWEAAAALGIPTSVIAGLLDPPDSLQASRDLAARILGAELVELPVDHLPQYRDPAAVADVVRRTIGRG